MGSELLYDVWQPNILVLPFFCFLVLMWAVFAGRSRALPFAVAVGSLCMQVHISHVVLVPALLVAGVVALVVHDRGETWVRHRGSLLISVGVGIVLWAPPLWEQFFGAGEGNMSRMFGSAGADESPRHGVALGVRILGAVLAVPQGGSVRASTPRSRSTPWVEDAGGRRFDLGGFPSVATALFWLVLVAAVVVVLVVLTRRAGQTFTTCGRCARSRGRDGRTDQRRDHARSTASASPRTAAVALAAGRVRARRRPRRRVQPRDHAVRIRRPRRVGGSVVTALR